MHVQLGQIINNKIQKDKKKPQTQGDFRAARRKSKVLVMIPAHSTTKEEQTPRSPPWSEPRTRPHPHLICGTGSPTLWSQQGNMLLVFAPS